LFYSVHRRFGHRPPVISRVPFPVSIVPGKPLPGHRLISARELSLYESQIYTWRSKLQQQDSSSGREQEMSIEIARLKRQLAEKDEELAILQKAATYFAKRLK